jgi:hypothetical protein
MDINSIVFIEAMKYGVEEVGHCKGDLLFVGQENSPWKKHQ